jgi:predicted TIM-barrel fold metal-dependent hydrolase
MGEKVIIVSGDGHAQAPPERWAEYVPKAVHEYLPSLYEESVIFRNVMGLFIDKVNDKRILEFDRDGAYRSGGVRGVFDLGTRLYEMDREGVAAEFIYNGDNRYPNIFFGTSNRHYPPEVCEAGVQAYHRWVHDTFGSAPDRLRLVGAVGSGPCADVARDVAELNWIADRGFAATSMPGFTAYPGQLPLSDPHWDPFWATCEERGLTLWVHAGHGEAQGAIGDSVSRIYADFQASGETFDQMISHLTRDVLTDDLFSSPRPRRPMWQLMFGGVFDRFPGLRLMMNEVRADWMPPIMAYLDRFYDAHRDELPAKRKPSEYWQENCMTCLSFVHKSEIEMRHDIGVDTLCFGRDYPHQEGTWPNTKVWLQDALQGVPEHEARAILGENIIERLGLDRAPLAAIAERIGPSIDDVLAPPANLDPLLLQHINDRGGYSKPAEWDAKLPVVEQMVEEDVATLAPAS